MRPSTKALVMAALGISIVFSSILLYLNAKAMVLGAGNIMLHWNYHGEGWPEFVLLTITVVMCIYALLRFYEEEAA